MEMIIAIISGFVGGVTSNRIRRWLKNRGWYEYTCPLCTHGENLLRIRANSNKLLGEAIEKHKDQHKPCAGKNSNRCVAEGCYHEVCLSRTARQKEAE